MVKVLFDSNILVDIMNGVPQARTEASYYSDITISAITWMEVMVGCVQPVQAVQFQTFLTRLAVNVIHTNDAIALAAVQIRMTGLIATPRRQIRLPDAIISATAQTLGLTVITRDPSDFSGNAVRVPYQIDAGGVVVNVLPPPA